MPLTLTIRNVDRLDNGSPTSLILDRRGAIIGRAPTTDWCLPDPSLHISSRHCEISYTEGGYVIADISTNGTFLKGSEARLPGPHVLNQGEVLQIGQFEITVALDDGTAASMAARNASPQPPQWKGWAASEASSPAPSASASQWDSRPVGSAISGTGPMSQNWAPPSTAEVSGRNVNDGWGDVPAGSETPSTWQSPPPPSPPASEWSSPVSAEAPPSGADDIWGKIAQSNVVDWARGGFGSPKPEPLASVQTMEPAPAASSTGSPPAQMAPETVVHTTTNPGGVDQLIAATGVTRADLKQGDSETLDQAGDLLRRLVAGLVVMLEARARAKSQMGAQGTSLEFDGNNPLKFARTPEQALAQLLNPPERGFMSADRAIEDAYKDLQAHQMATLKAMQGALRATLDRFSPTAIRARATQKGLMAKILPAARDAALWAAYEREFGGVAQGSDEAFMDMFAKEFRKAYEDIARGK